MELSIIIPTYNEEKNIEELISGIKRVLATEQISFEILVVDVGSTDNTQKIARESGAEVLLQKLPGYGGALKEGFTRAKGNWIVTMDADFSHDPLFIKELLKNRKKGELIVASRYIQGGSSGGQFFRRILSIILNRVFVFILSLPYKDISSGFRMYNKKAIQAIDIKGENFDVLEEILLKIHAEGYRVVEIPFDYKTRKSGKSHAKLFKFAVSYIKTLYKMWKLRNSLFSADYDIRAYNSRILIQRYWQRKRYNVIMNFIHDRARILDIGCGSSKIIRSLPDAVGLDIQLKKLRYLKETNKFLVKGRIEELPFGNEKFETVICSEVIEHIKFDKVVFTEISRVLQKGGVLIIGTPDYGRLLWRIFEFGYKKLIPGGYADKHITQYTRKNLIKLLREEGFDIQKYTYILGAEVIIQAVKKDTTTSSPTAPWQIKDILACPKCKRSVIEKKEEFTCPVCNLAFTMKDGIPDMLIEEATKIVNEQK